MSLSAFRTFGDHLDSLTDGFNSLDKGYWPKLRQTDDPEKMARFLRKYSLPLVNQYGVEIKEFFDEFKHPTVRFSLHEITGDVVVTSSEIPKSLFDSYVATQKESGLFWNNDSKRWFIPRHMFLSFNFPLYGVKLYNLGFSPCAFPTIKQQKSGLAPAFVPNIPYRSMKISRLADGKFEIRWNPFHPRLNDLFKNTSGMLSGITEYNPNTRARETFSIDLVLEAEEKSRKIIPDWTIDFQDKDKILKEREDFLERTKQQIPGVIKHIDPQYALFPFQNEGVIFLDSTDGNALLGDEMGLGKTLQTLAWAVMRGLSVLVVCPKVMRRTWVNEARKFFPQYFSQSIELTSNRKGIDLREFRLAAVNYESLKNFFDPVKKSGFDVLILDESQRLINMNTVTYQNVAEIKDCFKHKILCSGTAVKNKKHELYAQVDLIKPGLFESKTELKMMTIGAAWNRIRPIYLQRSKEQVLKQLPPKISQIIEIPVQAPDYDPAVGIGIEEIAKLKADVAIAKNTVTTEFVKDLLAESDSCMVVFSDSLEACKKIYEGLGPSVALLHHGQLSDKVREDLKEQFQKGHTGHRVFVSTRQSLAVGATLTRADKVVFNDLPWTASDVLQAEARCHRIGSQNTVNVYWIKAADNHFDTKVTELVKKKYELCKKMNEGKQLTAEEREWMNTPIRSEDFKNSKVSS